MPHDVFISYSTHDKPTADAACARLEAAGIRCWIAPRDITPGKEYGEAIIGAINQCRVMILIFSENANNSPQIHREVERAVNKSVPVLPLRIENIVPDGSLEYFIGTVHWLDALTPPLEAHLRRLVEAVTALLEIESTPVEALPDRSASSPVTPAPRRRFAPAAIGLAIVAAAVVGIGTWLITTRRALTPAGPQAASGPPPSAHAAIDPAIAGTLSHGALIDDYQWRFVDVIASDGAFHLEITQEEDGTSQAANGVYRSTAAKTGRVRTGTYRAVDGTGIAITSATGTAIFRPEQPGVTIDPANPVMLGVWQATFVQIGLTWTATLQSNADGTYHYQARAEDQGSCGYADQKWHCTSSVTGQSDSGVYRVVDSQRIAITGATGTVVWERH
jgi:hypothetical protein